MTHRFDLRVYHEDTDLAGIVYYANYLRYIERGRTEFVRGLGIDQVALRRDEGIVFAVRRLVADYVAPAVFDDLLHVETALVQVAGARLAMTQTVARAGRVLFRADVTLVALSAAGRPVRLPEPVRAVLVRGQA